MSEFSIGDQVVLKSGGPTMTIDSFGANYDNTTVNCVWFDSKHEPHEHSFQPQALTKVG